jgi:hypothetical protein
VLNCNPNCNPELFIVLTGLATVTLLGWPRRLSVGALLVDAAGRVKPPGHAVWLDLALAALGVGS